MTLTLIDAGHLTMADKKPKKWIKGAIKHPGALHRELGIPEDKPIPEARLRAAANSDNPTLARRARLAMTLKGMRRNAEKKEGPKRRSAKEMRHALYGSKE